ncbi:gephyrin-like molybdotransferase Glp [Alteromonas sp. H39]|uniref:molybdopterin molybdotransferase MoeA n=1 Tax=Alteromonas sp. H39 TaxID=3389876 RepID=UPI0039E08EF4
MPSATSKWLSLEDALQHTLALTHTVDESETIPLSEALMRIAANDVIAPVNVPPWTNSAMDGYAVCVSDLTHNDMLPVSTTVLAGTQDIVSLPPGTAARIMTGAPLPKGADTVIMQENAITGEHGVKFTDVPSKGENTRARGNDITKGDCILTKGTRLSPAHLMLLASQGITTVSVYRKIKVGLMATGDELCQPGHPLQAGQIYESNSTGISALLAELGVEIIHYGIVKDDIDTLTRTITEASSQTDLLLTTGGVSVGDADHVKPVIDTLGTVDFWKVAIKPGKPFAFGRVGNMVFCGVPGNPVSAYVTTQMLVTPVIERLQGLGQTTSPLRIQARLTTSLKRRPGRTDFQRAIMFAQDGQWRVTPLPNQSSGVMSSVTQANCYLELPAEQSCFDAEQWVTVIPFALRINLENTQ